MEIVDILRTFLPIHLRHCKTELKAGPESTNKLVFAFDRRHTKRDHQNRAGKAICLCWNPSSDWFFYYAPGDSKMWKYFKTFKTIGFRAFAMAESEGSQGGSQFPEDADNESSVI